MQQLDGLARRFGAAAVVAPNVIAAMTFWFKSSAITPVTDGTALATWPDSGGGAHDATQASGVLQPLYKTGRVNGLPSVLWDGSNDRLATLGITHGIGTGNFTLFALVRSSDVTQTYKAFASTNAGGDPGFYVHASKINMFWMSDRIFNTAIANNTWYFVIIERSGTTISCYINGVTDATTFTISTSLADGIWYLGNESAGTAATLNGDIVEAGLYPSALSSGQRAQLNTYASATYAIF